jgi:importin subunit alpha-1
LQVALDGLDNILKIGEMDKDANGAGAFNQYAVYIEEAGGMVSVTAGATSGRISVLT